MKLNPVFFHTVRMFLQEPGMRLGLNVSEKEPRIRQACIKMLALGETLYFTCFMDKMGVINSVS